jgi:hypothetical protein
LLFYFLGEIYLWGKSKFGLLGVELLQNQSLPLLFSSFPDEKF